MPHINDKPGQYDHTCSAFIIRMGRDPKIILHRHKRMGSLVQFGGHIELDENPWQCLIRELREESGYSIEQLKILQPKHSLKRLENAAVHPVPFLHVSYRYEQIDHHHSDLKYVFVTAEEPAYPPMEGESQMIQSFTRAEIAELDEEQLKPDDKQLCLYVFDEILSKWEAVDPAVFANS